MLAPPEVTWVDHGSGGGDGSCSHLLSPHDVPGTPGAVQRLTHLIFRNPYEVNTIMYYPI